MKKIKIFLFSLSLIGFSTAFVQASGSCNYGGPGPHDGYCNLLLKLEDNGSTTSSQKCEESAGDAEVGEYGSRYLGQKCVLILTVE